MKIINVILIVLAAAGKLCFSQEQYRINIEVEQISDRVIVVSGSQFSTNQVAIYSEKGIILIDTGISPEYAAAVKDSICSYFGTREFAYIINTHHHWDHVQGNQVFKDKDIIAHMNCASGMKSQGPARNSHRMDIMPGKRELDPDSIPPPPPSHILIDGNKGYHLTLPSITFNDQLKIRTGDVTINLIYYGECHTDNDIIVYIPEVKVLAVGDLFFKNSLPQIGNRKKLDTNRWLETLAWILREDNLVDFVIPGHNKMLTRNELLEYYTYLKDLSEGIKNEVSGGKSLEDITREYSLKNRFPDLLNKDMVSNDGSSLHNGNIEKLYNYFTRMQVKSQ